jgi:hypothetical protein
MMRGSIGMMRGSMRLLSNDEREHEAPIHDEREHEAPIHDECRHYDESHLSV